MTTHSNESLDSICDMAQGYKDREESLPVDLYFALIERGIDASLYTNHPSLTCEYDHDEMNREERYDD